MREASRQVDCGALLHKTITNADDLEALLVTVRDALDHVRNQRTGQAVQRAVRRTIGWSRDQDRVLDLLDSDVARDCLAQGSLGALDRGDSASE